MNDNMSVQEKRQYRRNEFRRKFGTHWLIYVSLLGTATLSLLSGLFLPLQPDANGVIHITFWTIMACLYYMVGFVSTGEGAGYYWFDKLTDHDKDNTAQVIIAGIMLFVSIVTIVVTALAGAAFVAFWLGAFEQFTVIPVWAQKWIVWAIPALWVAHAVAGMAFKAMSAESEAERDARASYWRNNASSVAKQIGEMEAQEEIDNFSVRLKTRKGGNPNTSSNTSNPPNSTGSDAPKKQETSYTLQDYLSKSGMSLSAAQTKFGGRRYQDFAADCNPLFDHISGGNMRAIFNELIPNPTPAATGNHR